MRLKIQNLSKTYANGTQALKGVNLEISNGMFGLLGPNGAGKSSLMRTLVTLQEADAGSIFLDDIDVLNNKEEMRKHIGYLPQEFGLYPKVSAEVLLDHFVALKGINDKKGRKQLVDELLDKTNLIEHRRKRLGGFSGGMKQRFGIAQALIGNPKLIVVDEPTAGLDPSERNRFHNLLAEIGTEAIVILSTHIVEDVKNLCTDMAILDRGQVKLRNHPSDAVKKLEGSVWEKAVSPRELAEVKTTFKVISERMFDGTPTVKVLAMEKPSGFSQATPDLEDVYFSTISQNLQPTA